ncbi:MAG: hypothetical protein IPK68_04840 [Bdellovibrionales bacterium]|nr:hypothetical protein [Bdellovibrionales bacterium]MBK8201658.1 hypothetical protein [Bdellovibrionales bacterium]
MDNGILKKKLNTFKSEKGFLKKVSDDVVLEVLRAWEHWPGTTTELNREIGLSKMQLVTMIQKAKRLVKNGMVPADDFKEIKVTDGPIAGPLPPCSGIEIAWDNGKLIRFSQVEQLIDFLKKVA